MTETPKTPSDARTGPGHMGPAFYDEGRVFETYLSHRGGAESPNATMEGPSFFSLLDPLEGAHVLDLGCGGAAFGREALARGAASYLGIEGSSKMVGLARETLNGTRGQVIHSRLEDWDYPTGQFTIVTSRLALHYVEDLSSLFARIRGALQEGGQFVFSVEHPVITSCAASAREEGRTNWLVDDYFHEGKRVTDWMGSRVVKYHHTLETFVGALQEAGFRLEALREGRPQPEHFTSQALYERRMRTPLFLLLAGRADDKEA